MKKEELRKCSVMLLLEKDHADMKTDFEGYFHKWFDYSDGQVTEQHAVVELESGEIKIFSMKNAILKFSQPTVRI